MSYLCDKEWWQGKHLNTYLLNSLNLNIADEVFAWNYFAQANARHRHMKKANAKNSQWLKRRHLMLVNSQDHNIQSGTLQCVLGVSQPLCCSVHPLYAHAGVCTDHAARASV